MKMCEPCYKNTHPLIQTVPAEKYMFRFFCSTCSEQEVSVSRSSPTVDVPLIPTRETMGVQSVRTDRVLAHGHGVILISHTLARCCLRGTRFYRARRKKIRP